MNEPMFKVGQRVYVNARALRTTGDSFFGMVYRHAAQDGRYDITYDFGNGPRTLTSIPESALSVPVPPPDLSNAEAIDEWLRTDWTGSQS